MNLNDLLLGAITLMTLMVTYVNVKEAYQTTSSFAVLETLLYIPSSLLFCAILTIIFSFFFKLLDTRNN